MQNYEGPPSLTDCSGDGIDLNAPKTTDLTILRMTAYPPGHGPYDRWEVTVEATGVVLIGGPMPVDQDAVRAVCAAYHEGLKANV